tara:strand:- start:406 stop:525 length:120 start_codon:yes stop_codon:yes gene_type:complete
MLGKSPVYMFPHLVGELLLDLWRLLLAHLSLDDLGQTIF